jgi:hypothetical protein
MPDIPTAIPDKEKIRALIWARGYSIADVARKMGRSPDRLHDITGRPPRPTGVTLLRQLAATLSTPRRPVRVSDISDWTGDDDEPEALASLDAKSGPAAATAGP